jgi:hypothetical protein
VEKNSTIVFPLPMEFMRAFSGISLNQQPAEEKTEDKKDKTVLTKTAE